MTGEMENTASQIIEAGKKLKEEGLIVRTWGNISARLDEKRFMITPSGRDYDSLTLSDIVTVNIDDMSYDGNVKPSSEIAAHDYIYKARKDAGFVIHTHQNFATAFGTMGQEINFFEDKDEGGYIPLLGTIVPVTRYARSCTKRLAENLLYEIERYPKAETFLLRNHGIISIGKDYADAFKKVQKLEDISRELYFIIAEDMAPDKSYDVHDLNKYIKETDKYKRTDNDVVLESAMPATVKYANTKSDLFAYIDDFAQMAGQSIKTLGHGASQNSIQKCIDKNGAVLIQGKGALISAKNYDDASAFAYVIEKNALSGLLLKAGARPEPVSRIDVLKEHRFYQDKYSKLNA
jgi:L-ribulose-5-phosphate 4-epimerase